MRSPNYDKYPATRTEGALFHGWEAIREALDRERRGPLAVDWYAGVHEAEITEGLLPGFSRIIRMRDLMKPEAEIRRMTDPFMTDDVLFGYVTNLRMPDFFDAEKLAAVRAELETAGEDEKGFLRLKAADLGRIVGDTGSAERLLAEFIAEEPSDEEKIAAWTKVIAMRLYDERNPDSAGQALAEVLAIDGALQNERVVRYREIIENIYG